ncbi:MAG: hypothetical protein SFV22_13955 [Saprospiraceae bacterium]|nr:hypothetical protein [Saprospiraceae bacterium]
MKKAIFFFAFFLAFGIAAADAQSCGSATAGKACCANKAAKAASADANIEKRQAEDGSISYVRKEADAQGNVKFVSVQYDEASNAFVNVAPKSATAGATATEGMVKKSCSASEAKACSASEKKACAGGASAGKACCAKPAATSEKKSEQ